MFVAETRGAFPGIQWAGDRDARQVSCMVVHSDELCSVWDFQMSCWAFA